MYFQEFLKIKDLCFHEDGPFEFVFLKELPNCKYYTDNTSEFDVSNNYNRFLSNASLYEYNCIPTTAQDLDEETYHTFLKQKTNWITELGVDNLDDYNNTLLVRQFESNDKKYYVCHLNISDFHEFFGVINKETEEYFFIGHTGSHDFICTQKENFSSTDGISFLCSDSSCISAKKKLRKCKNGMIL